MSSHPIQVFSEIGKLKKVKEKCWLQESFGL